MTLRELSALLSTILIIFGTTWYIQLAVRKIKVRPVLASWIVLSGTMSLSFATYWTSPNHSLVSNACNAISVFSTFAILVTTFWINKGGDLTFSPFQKKCLWCSLGIATLWVILVWGLGGTGVLPNILTQVLMLVGYLVIAQKLWHAEVNTESLVTWICISLAGIVALYTGIVSNDGLVILYAGRTTLGTGVIIWLMYRVENKNRTTVVR